MKRTRVPIPARHAPRAAASAGRLIAGTGIVLALGAVLGVGMGYLLWSGRVFAPTTEPVEIASISEPGGDVPERGEEKEGAPPGDPAAQDMETPPVDPIEEEFDLWPARHLFISVAGTSLTDAERELLRDLKPGGVVLTAENIRDAKQTRALVDSIKEAAGLGKSLFDLPLIAVDQEGGAVNRLNLGDAPSARELGAMRDMEAAREVAARYAKACRDRGIAVVLAPVLDVYEDGAAEQFAARSFGTDSRLVAALGLAFADGLMMNGMLAVAKHFPGHGATPEDSHEALAVLTKGKEGLSRLMYPFYEAVHCGLPGIMPGHIAVPALNPEEPRRPASLSSRMLRGFLRERWGYDGVIVSDDLAMQAIAAMYPMEEAVVAALQAGNDAVIVFEEEPDRVRALAAAIAEAVEAGTLERAELVQSLNRLDHWQLWLREPRGLRRPLPVLPEAAPEPLDVAAAEEQPDNEAHADDAAAAEAGTPGADAPAAPAANQRADLRETHVVQPGENLTALARRYGASVEQLAAWNRLDTTTILPGQELRIAAPAAPETSPPLRHELAVHEVQPGENLSQLAQRYGITLERLLDLNAMQRDDVLFVGKKLRVPSNGAETPTP